MISLLAEAATQSGGTLEVPAVATLIISIVTALGGAGAHKIITSRTTIDGQPIETRRAKEYATTQDIEKLGTIIRDNAKQRSEEIAHVHDKINKTNEVVCEIKGTLKTHMEFHPYAPISGITKK